jgi:nitroreductase
MKKAVSAAHDAALGVASKGVAPAKLYYLLFSRAFDSELLAVARGQQLYHCEAREGGGNQYFLRRSLHRLEKGLMQTPRRETFAVDYIREVVAAMAARRGASSPHGDADLLSWARSIVGEYFRVARGDERIDTARAAFQKTEAGREPDCCASPSVPYKRREIALSDVTYDQLHALAVQRRAIRWYLDKPVPRELVDKAIELAKLSPSACNRQPFEVRIVEDRDKIERMLKLAGGCGGFETNVPALAVIVGHLRAFFSERDRHLIHVDSGLFAMSFCLAMETLGLSSCCINFAEEAQRERDARKEISLGQDEKIVLLVAFGYADPEGMVAVSQKKGLDEIRTYESDHTNRNS